MSGEKNIHEIHIFRYLCCALSVHDLFAPNELSKENQNSKVK